MVDPLSTNAKSAAIIGLVDVSFRAGKELYISFGVVKSASKEAKSLQNELQDLNTILQPLRGNGGSPHSFKSPM